MNLTMDETLAGSSGQRRLFCKECRRGFSKAEHLRRHELSHTGARPFVCKECKRAFARQDALTRHERLHARGGNVRSVPESTAMSTETSSAPRTPDSYHAQFATNTDPAQDNALGADGIETASIEHHNDIAVATPELDLSLIWPDSEDLYQSIISSDAVQWQMLLGTLPLPPNPLQSNIPVYGSPSSFDDRRSPINIIPSGGSHQALQDVADMVDSSSSSVTAAVRANSITSVFLDECLHMFFDRFIPTFPVLHRATFVFRESTQPLLLNAIAIGSLYLGPKDSVAKGEALWRLAHAAVSTSWQTLITHRGPYDACKGVQLVITAVLSQVYGALSKNRAIRATSQIFRAHGFHWARHCGMFDSEPYSRNYVPLPGSSIVEKDRQWRIWTAREIQQRALLAHYILDGLVTQMFGESTSVRHTVNQLCLPGDEAAFEASSADDWLMHMNSHSSDQSSFRTIYRFLFPPSGSPPRLRHTFSAFSVKVLLEGLQSLVSDCDDDEFAAVGTPVKSDVQRALAQVYENINQNTYLSTEERLELLLKWHSICLETATSTSILCNSICSTYNITQHVVGGGKSRKILPDLSKWVGTENARRALLHAVAMQDIVEQLPRGRAHVIHMPSALFATATVYSIFSLAGSTRVNLPRTVIWEEVILPESEVFTETEACLTLGELAGSTLASDTRRYIRGDLPSRQGSSSATRNVLYELNSMQKLFRCLHSQWGISYDMENVIDQWINLCH
ncbi:hypothetical protein AJ80_00798 [Polytolypa hystricis UAMH7299]|uniref:C2H2-type domain-containing protein n=1 Tax=Polytolypa hystricis (strain UAMH7299) TaxID=1447883 RepID=A0A2B7Z402_POLH7|nr:hypothetical protein AJ80_00798 [Polytolypa hystricis UAMH7299]